MWVLGAIVGVWATYNLAQLSGTLAAADYDAEEEYAQDQAEVTWEQVQGAAEAARERARVNLESAVGELGAIKGEGAYDTWYEATRAEYDAAVEGGLEQSWADYLREQQMSDLGEYGLRRAELELTVALAEREFAIAEQQLQALHEGLDTSQRFVDRDWGQKAAETMRAHQTHQSAAGASGMRSGTAHETAKEYQVARMEGLDLWREKALYEIEGRRGELQAERDRLQIARDKLTGFEQDSMMRLDKFLTEGRELYDLDMADIQRGLDDARAGIDVGLSRFTDAARDRAYWTGFAGGAQAGFGFSMELGSAAGWF